MLKGHSYADLQVINANFLLIDIIKFEKNEPCLTLYVGVRPSEERYYKTEISPNGLFCLISSYEDTLVEKRVILVNLNTGKFVTLFAHYPISYAGFSKDGTSCFVWTKTHGFYVDDIYKNALALNFEDIANTTTSANDTSLLPTELKLNELNTLTIKVLTEVEHKSFMMIANHI